MSKVQIYLHAENAREPKLVEIDEKEPIQDIADQYLKNFNPSGNATDVNIFLEDEDEPLGAENVKIRVRKRCHVHIHRCKKITVIVFFNGVDKTVTFTPSTTAKKAIKVIAGLFSIHDSDAGDYVLKLEDGTTLQPNDHMGSYASHKDCSLKLFLTHKKPVQG